MKKAMLKTTNRSGGGINTTTPTTSDINYFDLLADDLVVNILCRLSTKHLAQSTLVSKAWHRIIIDLCLPILSCNHFGLLMCTQCSQLSFLDSRAYLRDSVTPVVLFNSSNLMSFSGLELLDCSNGLLLYCHRGKEIRSKWLYYVVNPITRHSVTIAKPSPRVHHVYAALVYDPSKSKDFKVVQFEDSSCLNIYSSKNRVWIKRKYQFEDCITGATWLKPSIYFNGAIYRLSMSGHLLKFVVDEAVNVQSQVIDLPQDSRDYHVGCMGLNNEHINYAVSNRSNLHIWVLHYQCNEYEWLLKYSLPFTTLEKGRIKYSYFKPCGFHPYLDVIFLGHTDGWFFLMTICNLSKWRLEGAPLALMDYLLSYPLNHIFAFPFHQSFVPLKGGTVDETACNFDVLDKFKRWWSQASQVLRPGT